MQNRYQVVTDIVPYSVFLWPWSAWRCILLLSDHFTRNMLTAYWIFFSLLLCIFFVCFWCFPFHSKLPLLGNWPLGKPLSRWILKLSPASLLLENNFYKKMLRMNLLKLCCWKDIRYGYCWYPDKEMSQASLVLGDNFYEKMLRMMRDAEYR